MAKLDSFAFLDATAHAELPDGPFAGVPFLLKDLLVEYAGLGGYYVYQ